MTLDKYLKKTRKTAEVNVGKINSHAKKGEKVVVPGKVLGTGSIEHAVTVYATGFSGSAKQKIEKAGGKALLLSELKDGKKVKVMR